MQTTYRIDRRFVLSLVGIQMIGAGLTAMLAFWVWAPLGILTVLLLLNALRVGVRPPVVARTDAEGARIGGVRAAKPVSVAWSDVEDVSIRGQQMVFDLGGDSSIVFSLAYLGGRANEFVRDVYERLNTANGYSRFDPSA
ncbi:hypothetical protein [Aeromicrobium wangtongii]|uniref:PH domain-containing protein n=1 Tax=Aeromicrobium wangtongii TaxID=2969247 RepID=A0ABY5MAW8_9ACTN|nr:hypothetical protein [Aeromicrobium wangtongii]MCD9199475.1 hypothetical protein [Aeromicrobium wangtongii]UUP13828.1 hypothetical protein NQV15_00515 [Aeromicrobium wangtongii]